MLRLDVHLAPAVSDGVPLSARTFVPGFGRRLLGAIIAREGAALESGPAGPILAVPIPSGGTIRLSVADACEQAGNPVLGLVWEPARRPETGQGAIAGGGPGREATRPSGRLLRPPANLH